MALRYLARRVGMPALRRASGPRVSPSTASGPVASRSSQAGYSNGDAGQKQSSQELTKRLAKSNASFSATADAIMRANRMRKIELRMYMGSAVISVCLAGYILAAVSREARSIMRERALYREAMELIARAEMEMDEALSARAEMEMDKADMEGGK
ncbi:unnamed protein product [Urochloa humidicola]